MNEQLWAKYGIEGLIMFAVIALLFIVIKWTLATTKEILLQAAKERELFYSRMQEVNSTMGKVCEKLDDHDKRADERGKYAREEHKQMIEVLGRINGFRHDK